MDAKQKNPHLVAHYEGLVRTTASTLEPLVEEEFDDICQFLRIKVWKVIEAFDPSKVKKHSKFSPDEQLERFVFGCLWNAEIDVKKKKRRNLSFIEDVAPVKDVDVNRHDGGMRDRFELKYLAVEDAYATVEEGVLPFLPSTLSANERRVAYLLFFDFKPAEIALEIGVRHKDVWALTKSIKEKMADWRPSRSTELEPIAA